MRFSCKAISGVSVVLCCFGSLYGSTFLIAKAGRKIVVGADSRSTLTINYTQKRPGPNFCKIRRCSDGLYFVIASTGVINTKTGIDFREIAGRACNASGSGKDKADWFLNEAVQAATRILREDGQPTVVSVAFFGFNEEPFYFLRSIRRTENELYKEPVDCAVGCSTQWSAGGYHSVIDKLASATFPTFTLDHLDQAVRMLLMKEIQADVTGDIGLPLSIIMLDKPGASGEHWIEAGACPAGEPKIP